MFFYLSKTLSVLLNPIIWVLIIGLYGLWKKKGPIIGSAFFLLYFLFLPYPVHWAMSKWEATPQPLQLDYYDVAVVLGGIIQPQSVSPNLPINFTDKSERIHEAIRLYHEGRIGKILLSGGSGNIIYPNFNESHVLQNYAEQMGVFEEDIIIEGRSRNTYQNALYTSMLITQKFSNPNILLITSAAHIKRARLTFKKQGIVAELYPVDYKSQLNTYLKESSQNQNEGKAIRFFKNLEPKAYSIKLWDGLIREIIGTLVYTLRDYI